MNWRNVLIAAVTMSWLLPLMAFDKTDDIKSVAEQWVKTVDANDGEGLKALLHDQMVQYTMLGEQLIPSTGTDFAKMVADKKLGGVPRKITIKSANVLRGNTAEVVLQAVSSEYDFMYQISLVKQEGKWLIVAVLTDIVKV